jgi:ElaB/YqjD/DUF883 family membrane-anchored ribosome-binding protein
MQDFWLKLSLGISVLCNLVLVAGVAYVYQVKGQHDVTKYPLSQEVYRLEVDMHKKSAQISQGTKDAYEAAKARVMEATDTLKKAMEQATSKGKKATQKVVDRTQEMVQNAGENLKKSD